VAWAKSWQYFEERDVAESGEPASPQHGARRSRPPNRVVDNQENANSINCLVFSQAVGKLFDARYSPCSSAAEVWRKGTGNEHFTQILITAYPQIDDFRVLRESIARLFCGFVTR
jgi:hypothetical protein